MTKYIIVYTDNKDAYMTEFAFSLKQAKKLQKEKTDRFFKQGLNYFSAIYKNNTLSINNKI